MASTTNFYIKPTDGTNGWVQVASNTNFVRISAYPHTHPFLVWYGSSLPTAGSDQVGIRVCHKPFWVNVAASANFWVKVPNPAASTAKADGSLRVDVLAF